tara:strand:+ start:222 stop:659 length:438 start_codon:yes stop_codon:yes gene_type:complete
MNLTKYRKYVVNLDKFNLSNKEGPWEQVYEKVLSNHPFIPFLSVEDYFTYESQIPHIVHPKVEAGIAYWSNNSNLCLGYKLTNNPEIFRPIYSFNHQDIINNFLSNIKRVVEKRYETLRNRAFIELFKIKRIPRILVDEIIEYTY